jgi:hypothetical protein
MDSFLRSGLKEELMEIHILVHVTNTCTSLMFISVCVIKEESTALLQVSNCSFKIHTIIEWYPRSGDTVTMEKEILYITIKDKIDRTIIMFVCLFYLFIVA